MSVQSVTCQQEQCTSKGSSVLAGVRGDSKVVFEASRSKEGELEQFCLRCFWREMVMVTLWRAQQWVGGKRKPMPLFKTWNMGWGQEQGVGTTPPVEEAIKVVVGERGEVLSLEGW